MRASIAASPPLAGVWVGSSIDSHEQGALAPPAAETGGTGALAPHGEAERPHRSAMVSTFGPLTGALLQRIVGGVVFGENDIQQLRTLNESHTVVYAMPSRSFVDYLYFNFAFSQHRLPLVRFANHVNTWALRRFFAALRALLGRSSHAEDQQFFRERVQEGDPTLVFLERPRGGARSAAEFGVPYLEALVEVQENSPRPVLVVPLLLVWDKHPDSERPTVLDEVFGTKHAPGFFRKMAHVARTAYENFLNLGAPQVVVGTPQELPSGDPPTAADTLCRSLSDMFERERRIIVGPGVKSAAQLRYEILTDERTREAIEKVARETGDDIAEVQKRAGDQIKEIAASFSMFVIKILAALLTGVWNQIYDGLEIDEDGLDRVRESARESRIVLVPSHKSHVDYLLLSYLFYRRGLIPPHIAAGINLSFWPLGPLFRRSGAFFLRRSFSGDPLYPHMFNAYLVKLLEEGFFIEFFIEGTRSRTGRLNPPKYGMLNMIVEAFRSGSIERLTFVPVSVGYQNIIEGSTYRKELAGGEKRGESVGGLFRSLNVLRQRYGQVYIEFGDPIDLQRFLDEYHEGRTDALEGEELARSVRRLAYRIIHRINDVTTVTPSALAALVVLNNPARAMDRHTLSREVGFVLSFLEERKARLSNAIERALRANASRIHAPSRLSIEQSEIDEFDREFMEEALPSGQSQVRLTDQAVGAAVLPELEAALKLLGDKGLVDLRSVDDETLYAVHEDARTELSYYRNNIVHYFVPEAVFATALYGIEGSRVPIESVRQYARFLSRLFKYEFCFEERQRFDEVFERTRAYFSARGWVEQDEGDADALLVTDPPPAGAEFLRALLLPNIEAYFVAAATLEEFAVDWIDIKALTRRALSRGEGMQMKGELIYSESIARTSLENAYRVFREWGMLEQRSVQKGRRTLREVTLTEAYRGERIRELCSELKAMVVRQKRTPGDLLRDV